MFDYLNATEIYQISIDVSAECIIIAIFFLIPTFVHILESVIQLLGFPVSRVVVFFCACMVIPEISRAH